MYSNPALSNLVRAAVVFAICIKDIIPSCILAPPETVKIIKGSFNSIAFSTA